MKVRGMSRRLASGCIYVNCRFWSHLGCQDGKSIFLPIQVPLRAVHKEIYILKNKKYLLYLKRARHLSISVVHTSQSFSWLLLHFIMVSFRVQIKPEPRPDWSPLGV